MRIEADETPARRPSLPVHWPGARIGLMGGSFDPPHEGHLKASLFALDRLRLDRVWWLVTPGNPLKDHSRLAPLADRLEAARRLARSPKLAVSGFEAEIRTRYTYDTLRALTRRAPAVRFVWIMGADNLASFHRWDKWRDIANLVPIAVVERPGYAVSALASPAARALARYRVPEPEAPQLPSLSPPAWVLLFGLRSRLSSTALRALRQGF